MFRNNGAIPEKTIGDFPYFIEFKISTTDAKNVKNKKDLLVNWKLSNVKTELPYSTTDSTRSDYAPCLQPDFLKQDIEAERLLSVNIFLRNDHFSPKQILMEFKGFNPHGPKNNYGPFWKENPQYILNIGAHRCTSMYSGSVSFTDTMEVIKKLTIGNYIYMVKVAGAVNKGLGQGQRDNEYTGVGGVDPEDVIAFRQLSTTDLKLGFDGSSLYIRESFLIKYGDEYLMRILSAYLENNEIATPSVMPGKYENLFISREKLDAYLIEIEKEYDKNNAVPVLKLNPFFQDNSEENKSMKIDSSLIAKLANIYKDLCKNLEKENQILESSSPQLKPTVKTYQDAYALFMHRVKVKIMLNEMNEKEFSFYLTSFKDKLDSVRIHESQQNTSILFQPQSPTLTLQSLASLKNEVNQLTEKLKLTPGINQLVSVING